MAVWLQARPRPAAHLARFRAGQWRSLCNRVAGAWGDGGLTSATGRLLSLESMIDVPDGMLVCGHCLRCYRAGDRELYELLERTGQLG